MLICFICIMCRLGFGQTLTLSGLLTSDDMHAGVGHPAHAGVTGVLARVGDPGLLHQQERGRDVALLRDLADAAARGAVGDRLEVQTVLKPS